MVGQLKSVRTPDVEDCMWSQPRIPEHSQTGEAVKYVKYVVFKSAVNPACFVPSLWYLSLLGVHLFLLQDTM
jgi:hypothetical protein